MSLGGNRGRISKLEAIETLGWGCSSEEQGQGRQHYRSRNVGNRSERGEGGGGQGGGGGARGGPPSPKFGEQERTLQCTHVHLPQTSGFPCRQVHVQ